MKKGLSKILSLACVFALLMTMMVVPAFAEDVKTVQVDFDPLGATYKASDVITTGSPVPVVKANGDANGQGVFVKSNNKVRFYKVSADKNADGKYTAERTYVTGHVYLGDNTKEYIFDNQGYLVIGDKISVKHNATAANGAPANADSFGMWIETDKWGVTHQYVIGAEGAVRANVLTTPENFYIQKKAGFYGKAYYENGEAIEGRKDGLGDGTQTIYQKTVDGVLQLVTGVQVDTDATGNGYLTDVQGVQQHVYGYVGGYCYDNIQRIEDLAGTGKNKWKYVSVNLDINDDGDDYTDDGEFVIINRGTTASLENVVLTDDGEGHLIIMPESGVYFLTNENGSIITNLVSDKPNNLLEVANVYKINGKLTDLGKVVPVKVGDYTQNFYIPVDSRVAATDYYRYVPLADGSGYEGLTYYNENGITYAGWVQAFGSGSSRTLKYQTIIRRAGQEDVYIIVAGPQYLEAGADPADLNETIPAGWYLFDEHGSLVKSNLPVKMYGKTYVLNSDNQIVSVNGEAPTAANVA